ncbi:enoyl-CoA hydratase-related protein [Gordonia sp. (in: high G+C Gram-positive bacteria)]|uniref:enoyl-CoA hydratase-related protein n=1 Tax=Gordonia sp. (in: high G+C Gram-positive bacteria) TaxID=84139 RepID=UPI003C7067B4
MRVDRDGAVVRIAFDRPGTLNSVDVEVLAELSEAVRSAGADPAVRVIVLSGQGRAFSSGADMAALSGPPEELMDAANTVIRDIVAAPVPVIAEVGGPAVGFGVGLACAADLVYASSEAYFLLSFGKIGLMVDGGASLLITAAAGRARAGEMALLCERMPAAEAAEHGLVNKVLADREQLSAHVRAVADKLAAGPRRAQELSKKAISAAAYDLLDDALDREKAGQVELLGSADCAEGVAAFTERRDPVFAR